MNRTKQIEFLKLWASLKLNGSPDREIITSMHDDYLNIMGDCAESRFCDHALTSLQNWNGGFSQAMVGWFDDDLALLVRTCKKANNVEQSLSKMLVQTEKWFSLKKDILLEIIVNGLFLMVAFSVFTFVCTIGLTYATKGVEVKDISSIGQSLMTIGVFIENKGIVLIVLFFCIVGGLWFAAIHYVGEKRSTMDRVIPFYGFYMGNCSSRFFTMLDVMLSSSDISLRSALEELQGSGLVNRYISSHVDEMLYRLKERRGGRKGGNEEVNDFDTLDTGLLPPILRLRLKNISKSNDPKVKASTMKTISDSLIKDQGELMRTKVKLVGRMVKLSSGVTAIFSIVVMMDGIFMKIGSMQGM